jgi:hypothetical protein
MDVIIQCATCKNTTQAPGLELKRLRILADAVRRWREAGQSAYFAEEVLEALAGVEVAQKERGDG